MALWFLTSVVYEKMMENGTVKKVTEKYLFDSLTFSESETRTIEELTPYISGEFTIKANKKTPIAEVVNIHEDYFYLAKVAFITFDEKTGAEKKSITQILIGAENFDSARKTLNETMKDTISDWEVVSLALTDIVSVFPHTETETNN